MTSTETGPGSATLDQLQIYWRMPSGRATRELARSLGVRRVAGAYPWFAIWAAEGLAVPNKKRWQELKQSHCTTADVAVLLKLSRRQAQRLDETKPDPTFPDALSIRDKPKLWRRAQVQLWRGGLPVPHYKTATSRRPCTAPPEQPAPSPDRCEDVFNPSEILRSADTQNDKMT